MDEKRRKNKIKAQNKIHVNVLSIPLKVKPIKVFC
jgi:hypothetical protein